LKNNEWLMAQSLERVHELLSAINTISIRSKLSLAGIDDSAREAEVEKAQKVLLAFLEKLQVIIGQAERHRDGTVIGTDPRLGQLAKRLLSTKSQWPRPSGLYSLPLSQVRDLLASNKPDNLRVLVDFLRDLRSLVEQHAHSDITGILGEI
jgi:hypothetical protein